MVYDEDLAMRVREIVREREGVHEQKMFGGIAFMVGGNMAVGVNGSDLIVRVAPSDGEAALAEPHVRPMDFTGRPMKGWLFVGPGAVSNEEALRAWVDRGVGFAASLPKK